MYVEIPKGSYVPAFETSKEPAPPSIPQQIESIATPKPAIATNRRITNLLRLPPESGRNSL